MFDNTISKIAVDEAIRGFANRIDDSQLGLVKPEPESSAVVRMCISNVIDKVARSGSREIFGWCFLSRFNTQVGNYLIATHHSIWQSPSGSLIDITPFHEEASHRPIVENGHVLFLFDGTAKPIERCNLVVPMPSRFIPLTHTPDMEAYLCKLMADEERDHHKIVEKAR